MLKVLIWGTGKITEKIRENGIYAQIIGYVETKKSKDSYKGLPIYEPDELPENYDYLLVANRFSGEIYKTCSERCIDLNKVIFWIPGKREFYNRNVMDVKEILGDRNFTMYQSAYGMYENTFIEEDMQAYTRLNKRKSFEIKPESMWPIITDKYAMAGTMNNYFWQDLWAARHIIGEGCKEHYDIGSRIDGFIAHLLAAGIKVNMIDIREFPGKVDNLCTIVDDATLLNHVEDNSLRSLSALCSLEHFGLGRYGDKVDPEACFKCFEQINKKMQTLGKLYISVPIGRERVEFNAHRVFAAQTIVQSFPEFELEEFSCAAEGQIEYHVSIHKYDYDEHDGEYRYGLFRFVKR